MLYHNGEISGLAPTGTYWYTFSHGSIQFFAMDTRFERHQLSGRKGMISTQQEEALKDWLSEHRDAMKFIITAVPFLQHVHLGKSDKWCGDFASAQRDRILEHIGNEQIGRITFLTGDMHASYCARATLGEGVGSAARPRQRPRPLGARRRAGGGRGLQPGRGLVDRDQAGSSGRLPVAEAL